MIDLQPNVPYVMPDLQGFFPEQAEAIGAQEVWASIQKIQTSLRAQYSLIETNLTNQLKTIQANHSEVIRYLEQQNRLTGQQSLFLMIGVCLLAILLILAIIGLVMIGKQKKKMHVLQDAVNQLDKENRWLADCQNWQNSKLEAIWNKLFAVNESTIVITKLIQEHKSNAPEKPSEESEIVPESTVSKPVPEYTKPTPQAALPKMLMKAAANSSEGWGKQVQQALAQDYHLNINYYSRRDPSGSLYQGVVERADDDTAPFFGVTVDGCLHLLPNNAYLSPLAVCAGEFFTGYQTVGNGISTVTCAVLDQEGDCWRLKQLGSINQ